MKRYLTTLGALFFCPDSDLQGWGSLRVGYKLGVVFIFFLSSSLSFGVDQLEDGNPGKPPPAVVSQPTQLHGDGDGAQNTVNQQLENKGGLEKRTQNTQRQVEFYRGQWTSALNNEIRHNNAEVDAKNRALKKEARGGDSADDRASEKFHKGEKERFARERAAAKKRQTAAEDRRELNLRQEREQEGVIRNFENQRDRVTAGQGGGCQGGGGGGGGRRCGGRFGSNGLLLPLLLAATLPAIIGAGSSRNPRTSDIARQNAQWAEEDRRRARERQAAFDRNSAAFTTSEGRQLSNLNDAQFLASIQNSQNGRVTNNPLVTNFPTQNTGINSPVIRSQAPVDPTRLRQSVVDSGGGLRVRESFTPQRIDGSRSTGDPPPAPPTTRGALASLGNSNSPSDSGSGGDFGNFPALPSSLFPGRRTRGVHVVDVGYGYGGGGGLGGLGAYADLGEVELDNFIHHRGSRALLQNSPLLGNSVQSRLIPSFLASSLKQSHRLIRGSTRGWRNRIRRWGIKGQKRDRKRTQKRALSNSRISHFLGRVPDPN